MTPAKLTERKARIQKLNRALKKLFPDAKIELIFSNPWELMVAVQLSAQSTDKGVNKVTEKLFKKYKTLDDYVRAGAGAKARAAFVQDVRSINYYQNKAKNILAAAKIVKEKYNGVLPKTMEELIELPGVGRKTANVFLAEAHDIYAGVTVDTHVIRFAQRYDLSDYKDPIRIEKDLIQLLPKKEWRTFTHRVIWYGRRIAPARIYDTAKDPLVKIYPPAAKKFRTT